MKLVKSFLFLILVILVKTSVSQIVVTSEAGFLKATRGPEFGALEDVSTPDNGGLAYFFVTNENESESDAITEVRFHVAGTYYEPDGMRVWPKVMNPKGQGNNVSTITVKGIGSPFKEDHAVTVEVETENGHTYVLTYTLFVTPDVRIGNIIIGNNNEDLYVFLRNHSTTQSYSINQLLINELSYDLGISPDISIIGDNQVIAPRQIKIIKIHNPFELYVCLPVALRIKTVNISTSEELWASAGVRLTETIFSMGTWESSLFNPENEFARKKLRKLGLDSNHGPSNSAYMQNSYSEYFMRNIWEPNFGDPLDPNVAIPVIQANAGKEYVEFWSVDDEPDLHSKPVSEELLKNQTYWENDPYTPSYVNLCVQKKYQRYGWMTDVVAMDHYAAADAPNIIPMTWVPVVGRTGKIAEAIEYTDYLKYNTEPRRMHAWCQLASGVWGVQPRDYSVNYQFWAHIMAGAKGIHWFTAKANTDNQYPEQWNEAIKLTNQFNQIKNLCLWGESADIVTASANNIKARAIVGEDAMIVVVLNNKITFSYNAIQLKWNSSIDDVNYWVEFTVPDWIPIEEIYRVTANGKVTNNGVQHLGGTTYRIDTPDNIYKESHVFVFGKYDTTPPNSPESVLISENPDPFNYTFSWKEPWDNFGVMGYKIYRNAVLIDDVRHPIYEVINGFSICEPAVWSFVAYDNSGNESSPALYEIFGHEPATSVSVIPAEACLNGIVTVTPIGGSTGSGGEWHWFKNNCDVNLGGELLGIGNPFQFVPDQAVENYYVQAVNQCGSSECTQFSIPFAQAPIDANIFASENAICLGQSVTISTSGGSGEPVYFCSDNGGVEWNIFSNANQGEETFLFTPQHEGVYLIHVRNRNHCGFCWDFGAEACGDFQAVEITVNASFSTSMTRIPTEPQCTGTQYVFYAHPVGGSGTYTYKWYVNDELQTSVEDTLQIVLHNNQNLAITYNVKVVVSDGACSAEAIMTPTVYGLPADADVIIGSVEICPGQTNMEYSIAEIEGATSYVWNLPEGATGTSTTNTILVDFNSSVYSDVITVYAHNSCGNGAAASLELIVPSVPIDSEIFADHTEICLGEEITISSVGGTGSPVYFCSDDGGANWNIFANEFEGETSFSFTPEHAGTYRFHVKNQNNCGFCWDYGIEQCNTFYFVDVEVYDNISVNMTRVPTGPQCSGTDYVFYAHVNGGSGDYQYNWYVDGVLQDNDADTLQIVLYNNTSITINPNVTVIVNNGDCEATAQMTPTLNPFPVAAEQIVGDDYVCQGQNDVMYSVNEIDAAISYEWTLPEGVTGNSTTNSINVNFGLSASSGEIIVRGINNCGHGEHSVLFVNVNPVPETPVIVLDGNILNSNYEDGNQWYNQNDVIMGANNQSYSVYEDGDYYVIVTIDNCESEPSNVITVVLTSIAGFDIQKLIKVYPNPVKDVLLIESELDSEILNIELCNSLGQLLMGQKFSKSTELNMSEFASGIYYLHITGSRLNQTIKIVKE